MKALSLLAAVVLCATAAAAPPVVRTLEKPTLIEVTAPIAPGSEVRADEELLAVSLLDDAGDPGPPILGRYRRGGNTLTFRPHFALTPGARYRVASPGGNLVHEVPQPALQPAAVIEAVYPAVDEVPANLLKFYIYFSKPMREGREIFAHFHLVDQSGREVQAPWRDTELWTEDARRLTLWMHPGRVKRGVNLREELGPVLTPGERYALVIDAGLRDATGQPLGREYRREFRTQPERHARLDLSAWEMSEPAAGTKGALTLRSPVAIDHVLAGRCIRLTRDGKPVPGKGSLDADGRTWQFEPEVSWAGERYRVEADPWLEDLAGNTFERVFDDEAGASSSAPTRTAVEFTPRASQ